MNRAAHADQLAAVARSLAKSNNVVVLTGAGVSAESQIPTFRGGMDALWKDFDPMTLATPEAFARDPATVSRWYEWRRQKCLEAGPNPGHLALAEIERRVTARGGRFTLLTQNVDRLHQKAGSRNVVELHGTIMVWRCTATGREVDLGSRRLETFPAPSEFHPGALLRPAVVWFGEMLPPEALQAAEDALAGCDLYFCVGTSSVVFPAAGFIQAAARNGATTVEVNPDPTPISPFVTHSVRARSGEWLPLLLN